MSARTVRPWSARRAVGPILGLAAALWGARGAANGRFPRAQYAVVGPGAAATTMAVRTTFGVVISDDGGRSFRFLCEDAFQFPDGYDPALALGAGATLLVGVPDGLQGAALDRCAVTDRPELRSQEVTDLVTDAAGRTVFAAWVSHDATPASGVARSDDGGARFQPLAGRAAGVAFQTVEVAPSDARRLYATGVEFASPRPRFYRSEDGGGSWRATAAGFAGAAGVFVSAVDPARPERVYARVQLATAGDGGAAESPSALLRSEDGGEHFRELARTFGPMHGFALADDGATVWIGGPDPRDGLQRSGDGGEHFQRAAAVAVECLRWHAGALYVCGHYAPGAMLLGRSRDGGSTIEPLVRFSEVLGPPACGADTLVGQICPLRWSLVRPAIDPPRPRDAGSLDATPGAGPPAPPGCGCRAQGPTSGAGGGAGSALLVACARAARRRAVRQRASRSRGR